MALIIETGNGNEPTANSYVSLAETTTYLEARNRTTWAAQGQPIQEAAILNAMDYLEYNYVFRGCRDSIVQPLEWPRNGAYYDDNRRITGVPIEVKRAIYELAFRALTVELNPDIAAGSQPVSIIVDVVEIEYNENASALPRWTQVESLLSTVTVNSSRLRRLI